MNRTNRPLDYEDLTFNLIAMPDAIPHGTT